MRPIIYWIDARFPLRKLWRDHMAEYYAPKNLNFWYYFGSIALTLLLLQYLTGIFLAMNYKPDAQLAFDSVESIMRDFDWGWLIRYLHATGASMLFLVLYLHIFRGLLYGSYKRPRELVWLLGMALFLAMMAEAFMGYLLPWGQMSYWGANVILELIGTLPLIGEPLLNLLRGDLVVSDITLGRFFALHVIAVPIVILFLLLLHLIALHEVGSNNPDGVEIKALKDERGRPVDGIPFHPYYTVKDLYGVAVFFTIWAAILFYFPEMGGYFLEPNNFEPANPLKTPEHIAPLWYFTPFYSILRAVPSKLGGVVAMFTAIFLFFFLPWLDRCPVRSIRYRGDLYRIALTLFTVSFVGLAYLGTIPPTPAAVVLGRLFAAIYFAFFLLMPLYTRYEKTLPVPDRIVWPPPSPLERENFPWPILKRVVQQVEAHPLAVRGRQAWQDLNARLIRLPLFGRLFE